MLCVEVEASTEREIAAQRIIAANCCIRGDVLFCICQVPDLRRAKIYAILSYVYKSEI